MLLEGLTERRKKAVFRVVDYTFEWQNRAHFSVHRSKACISTQLVASAFANRRRKSYGGQGATA